jgi:hypothetical protein
MKTISTYITPAVYLAMKEAAEAEGVKLWRFIEEGIRWRIANSQNRTERQTAVQPAENKPLEISQVK